MKKKKIKISLHKSNFLFFRSNLDKEIESIEDLEEKLDKVLKFATIAVDQGKKYIENQS